MSSTDKPLTEHDRADLYARAAATRAEALAFVSTAAGLLLIVVAVALLVVVI
jgi:hypothetical protein